MSSGRTASACLSDPPVLKIFCVPVATLVREVRLVDCHLQPAGSWYLTPPTSRVRRNTRLGLTRADSVKSVEVQTPVPRLSTGHQLPSPSESRTGTRTRKSPAKRSCAPHRQRTPDTVENVSFVTWRELSHRAVVDGSTSHGHSFACNPREISPELTPCDRGMPQKTGRPANWQAAAPTRATPFERRYENTPETSRPVLDANDPGPRTTIRPPDRSFVGDNTKIVPAPRVRTKKTAPPTN